ncbi:tetratricopeptide repeat protein [Oceanobacillus massiliensis]|uniref:tetratricopeptide repeat protein n=1 Tax=Oceanobacillus massiliensis TaxID=1465765 RepID=UPI000288AE5B|nr:tetratricopeptide repeat protein [Oceanobacillus massiliensis]
MESKSDNVILFPKLKKTLEEESLKALQEKRYEEALVKLDKLISYQEGSHEIMIGKLICLMELGRHEEAQDLCEELIKLKDENYYHYVHIYLTILFQTSQYGLLMEQVEYEFEQNQVPEKLYEQFKQLYDMSEKMKLDFVVEETDSVIDELFEAVNQDNHMVQWRIVDQLRNMKARPVNQITSLLTNELVHPVIKTAILAWMREQRISEEVEIHKLGSSMTVIPSSIPDIKENEIYEQILLALRDVEQKNPTLFKLLEQLLYRYVYVTYPLAPSGEDVSDIVEAIKYIGNQYLQIHSFEDREASSRTKHYIKEIRMCDSLYLSIIEE